MSVTIEIAPDLEERLHSEAARTGLDDHAYILEAIEARLRASDVPHLPAVEADLLLRINDGPSERTWQRYNHLVAIRRAGALTPEEHLDLLALTGEIEEANARRIGYLVELARLRGRSLREIMKDLGIEAPAPD
jgi:predicted DNA-binding protein